MDNSRFLLQLCSRGFYGGCAIFLLLCGTACCVFQLRSGALINPQNAVGVNSARLRMAHVGEVNQAGFSVLLDVNATVLAAPNAPELQGKYWNPAGIVKDTLKSGLRYTRSGLVTWGEMQTFHLGHYTEKLQNSTPTSHLHPFYANISSAENIIRWTSVPVSEVHDYDRLDRSCVCGMVWSAHSSPVNSSLAVGRVQISSRTVPRRTV